MTDDLHVMPILDDRAHIASEDCWCEPRIEGEGPFVVVHHSADGRERREPPMPIPGRRRRRGSKTVQ